MRLKCVTPLLNKGVAIKNALAYYYIDNNNRMNDNVELMATIAVALNVNLLHTKT